MNIVSAAVYHFSLELARPLVLSQQTLMNREGFVLHLTSDQGYEGFGEIAPLPGFSPETLDEARDQALILKHQLCDMEVPLSIKALNGGFERWVENPNLKPSVRFAVESAVLGLISASRNISIGQLIPQQPQPKIRIAGLLSGSNDEIALQTKDLLDKGFKELKMKVAGDPREAIKKVRTVNDVAYGKALLHIDVNQAWDFYAAVDFGKEIGCAAVNYIEEPFKDITKIPEFFDETMIPVALDESIQHLSFDDIRLISGVDFLVLKPTILGGIEKTKAIIDQARSCGLSTTVSSSFESSLGISALAGLAGTSSHGTAAAGLDTLKWFKEDLLNEPLRPLNGTICLSQRPISKKDINFNLLRKVE